MKYNGHNLKEVLEAHKRWLNDGMPTLLIKQVISVDEQSIETEETSQADFRGCDIYGADFEQADLRFAIFDGAALLNPNFHLANLQNASFEHSSLYHAKFEGAELWHTNFGGSKLTNSDFTHSYLCGAIFGDALLDNVCFKNASLDGVREFNLAINAPFIPMACPDEGSFIGWKIAHTANGSCIIKLLIPETAKRSSAGGRKCRCDIAKVLDIQDLSGKSLPKNTIAFSNMYPDFAYRVGKTVRPANGNFDENRWDECSYGIHFFINRQEAVEY